MYQVRHFSACLPDLSSCLKCVESMQGKPCGGKECNVCSICSHGFLLKGTGGLFGKGLYFSSQPDKANAYAQPSEKVICKHENLKSHQYVRVASDST